MSRRRRDQPQAQWDFFSFPVYFAFALGALIGITLALFLGYIAFLAALFGTAFGFAHLIGHSLRQGAANRRRRQAEEDERERRALAAREAAVVAGDDAPVRRRRRRARRNSGA